MASFEQALDAYRQLVIDMDGDGIPDAPLQQPSRPEPFREQLQRDPRGAFGPQPEMRSYTPTPGDHVRQATGSPMAGQVTNAMLQYGPIPAQEFVNQPFRTGTAINEAIQDPSLAKITNAGVQSALTAFQPTNALRILGAGYGVAAARDLGFDPFSSASAQEPPQTETPAAAQVPDEMTQILTRQQGLIAERDAAKADMDFQLNRAPKKGRGPNYDAAKREFDRLNNEVLALDQRINQIREANSPEAQLEAQRAQEANAEYQRAIKRADTLRADEEAKRWTFEDSNIGQVFRETGGAAPVLAGAAGGFLGRLGHGGSNRMLVREGMPLAEGAFAGATAANIPVMANALYSPVENPEKRAAAVYGRELPPGHPRKQEYLDYAEGLPTKNPVREEAGKEFYGNFLERTGMGMLEGFGGALIGTSGVKVGERGINAMLRGRQPAPPQPVAQQSAPARPAPVQVTLPNGQVRWRDPQTGNFTTGPTP